VIFVRDPFAPTGASNTLEIRVDGALWQETESLYGHKPNDRAYTTRLDDEGRMVVEFGDGSYAARLPSGLENVIARYRVGTGAAGNVGARTVATLLDRPRGVREVTNPARAEGGADAEGTDGIRQNAPNAIRTFGRIVSLRDFEDVAREFAGVAKVRASWEWAGDEQVVRLTVAGDEGRDVPLSDLVAYLDARRDTQRKLVVGNMEWVSIRLQVAIQVHPDFVKDEVLDVARESLKHLFDFGNRNLGEPVFLIDVYAAAQAIEGVVGVDVNRLQFKRESNRKDHGASPDEVQDLLRLKPFEMPMFEEPEDFVVSLGISAEPRRPAPASPVRMGNLRLALPRLKATLLPALLRPSLALTLRRKS